MKSIVFCIVFFTLIILVVLLPQWMFIVSLVALCVIVISNAPFVTGETMNEGGYKHKK